MSLVHFPARNHEAALPTTNPGSRTPGVQAADTAALRHSSGRLLYRGALLDQGIKQIAPQPPVWLGLTVTPLQFHQALPLGIVGWRMAQVVMKHANTGA